MLKKLVVLSACCAQCLLCSVPVVFSVCCAQCLLCSVLVVLNACGAQCLLCSVPVVLQVARDRLFALAAMHPEQLAQMDQMSVQDKEAAIAAMAAGVQCAVFACTYCHVFRGTYEIVELHEAVCTANPTLSTAPLPESMPVTFVCDNCGEFKGTFEVVEKHEAVCSVVAVVTRLIATGNAQLAGVQVSENFC